jgi:hypothetical protein
MTCYTIVSANKAHAQAKHNETALDYRFEASLGVQSFQLNSNINSLNQSRVDQYGGSIGLNFGNELWQAKIKPFGYYNSSSNSLTTVKLIESSAHINFYPLSALLSKPSRLPNLYLTGGIARAKIKINGSFLQNEQTVECTYLDNSFTGNILSWNLLGGVGMEYKILLNQTSINLFTEIKKGLSAGSSSDKDLFKNTSINNFTMVNIGFSIGINN